MYLKQHTIETIFSILSLEKGTLREKCLVFITIITYHYNYDYWCYNNSNYVYSWQPKTTIIIIVIINHKK